MHSTHLYGKSPITLFGLLFCVGLALSAATPAAASDLKVANARTTVPDAYENATAYFVIQNKSSEARTIVGGTCSGCDWVEIHRAVLKNGMMDTEKLEEMTIPAGGAVAFVPRGLSLELVGLEKVSEGDAVQIELDLKNGEKLAFEATAKDD